MGIKVALEHRTSYTFDRLVEVHPHVVRLRPAPHSRTPIEAYSLQVEPADHFINWQQDAFGNFLARLVFPNRDPQPDHHRRADRRPEGDQPVRLLHRGLRRARSVSSTPRHWSRISSPTCGRSTRTARAPGPGDLSEAWVNNFSVPPGTRTIDFLVALNRAINADVGYSVRMEPGVQTPDFTLRTGIGSCRDSAWLLVSVLRQLGLAARFVSGYLVQLTSDVEALDGPSGPTADFTDLHAWTEVYIPGAGWIGMDPTSGLFAGEGHIPLSATPHPASAAPITGSTEPSETTLEFSNVVTRVHEDPRVTLPYTEAAWAAINALGARVDERLAAGDVRLTVGGEPTFVSIDNQVDPEWTTDADGPHKRERASALAARLKKVWAPQGLVQRNQGKWYPGEPLPRWQIGLYWRADGEPLWTDEELLADPWHRTARHAPRCPRRRPSAARRHRRRAGAARQPGAARLRGSVEPAGRVRCVSPQGDPVAGGGRPRRRTAPTRAPHCWRGSRAVTEPAAYVLPLHRRDDELGLGQRRLEAAPRAHRAAGRGFACRAAAAAGLDQLEPPPVAFEADPTQSRPRCEPASGRGRGRGRRCRGRRGAADDRAGRRGPGRPALRLPAAHRGTGPLRRPGRPDRGRGRQGRLPAGDRGLRPADGCPAAVDVGHPRPRRHRGQRGAHGQLRRATRAAARPSTSRRGRRGCPPSRSTSTAPTAEPAAATTSPSAVSRPPIPRCCGALTCWSRC